MSAPAGAAEIFLTYSIRLRSVPESINLLETFLSHLFKVHSLKKSSCRDIWVCLNEAVTNAITHGNLNQAKKLVSVDVQIIPDRKAVFTVADEGCGFKANKLDDPILAENLGKDHGRGVYLIKSIADDFIVRPMKGAVEMHFRF